MLAWLPYLTLQIFWQYLLATVPDAAHGEFSGPALYFLPRLLYPAIVVSVILAAAFRSTAHAPREIPNDCNDYPSVAENCSGRSRCLLPAEPATQASRPPSAVSELVVVRPNKIAMWAFDQPRNAATLTTSHVMKDGAVITRAYHDEDDHGWQFYSEHVTQTKDAMVVALDEIVSLDQSVNEISDLPPGWMAQRTGRDSPWHRTMHYADAAQVIVDWSKIMSEEDFYDTVLLQCGSPAWHGRNLDALADSWITGGIDQYGPPYAFGFRDIDSVRPNLISFRDAVLKIAAESIDENGGRYITQAEQGGAGQPDTRPKSN